MSLLRATFGAVRSGYQIIKSAGLSFARDDALTLAASLAFYTAFSFAPLIVLSLWLASSINSGAQDYLLDQLGMLAGENAKVVARVVIDSAEDQPTLGNVAGMIGLGVLLVGATTVFAQLQASLNLIWNLKAQPSNAIWGWLRRRLLSIGILAAFGFVLATSLLVSTVLALLLSRTGMLWDILNQALSLVVFTALFAALFRFLPDARIPWRDTLVGAFLTAVLFVIGKWLIGLYLGQSNVGGAYGPAASVVVLLIWIYYSAAIFFFGAELVQAYVKHQGRNIEPAEIAVFANPDQAR